MLGDFRIVRLIGYGGMGVVYEAEQLSLGRTVALKVLSERFTDHPGMIRRFKQEASLAARLRHPGIAEIHAVDEADGKHYFAMAFIEGSPLNRVIERVHEKALRELDGSQVGSAVSTEAVHALDAHAREGEHGKTDVPPTPAWNRGYVETVCGVVARVADALDHAHRAGVVHRDVKPSNIILRSDMSTVLVDFGLARVQGLPSVTKTGVFAGTPYYVSPEQAMASKRATVDHRTDIYSLGVTLYELLTLRRPFEGDSDQEVLSQIIAKPPRKLRQLNPRVPSDLEAVCMTALQKDPDRRYKTAAEFAVDIRRVLDGRPVIARPVGLPDQALRWVKRNPVLAATFLALLTVAAFSLHLIGLMRQEIGAKDQEIAAGEDTKADNVDLVMEVARLERAERAARSQYLLAEARQQADLDPGLALLLTLEAHRLHDDLPQRNALVGAVAECKETRTLMGHADEVVWASLMDFGSDKARAATCSRSGEIWIWDLDAGTSTVVTNLERRIDAVAADVDSKRIVVVEAAESSGASGVRQTQALRVLGLEPDKPLLTDGRSSDLTRAVSMSPHGEHVIAGDDAGGVRIWNDIPSEGFAAPSTRHRVPVRVAAFGGDEHALTADVSGWIHVWNLDPGAGEQPVMRKLRHAIAGRPDHATYDPQTPVVAAFNGAGRWVVASFGDGILRGWNVVEERSEKFGDKGLDVVRRAFAQVSRLAMDATDDGIGFMRSDSWSIDLGDQVVSQLTFDLDKQDLFLAVTGPTVRIGDCTRAADGATKMIGELSGHGDDVVAARFIPKTNGRRIVTASADGTARVWDASEPSGPWNESRVLRGHGAALTDVRCGRDGERIITASADGTARVWDIRPDRIPDPSREWAVVPRDGGSEGEHLTENDDRTRMIEVQADGSVSLHDLTTGTIVFTIPVPHGRTLRRAGFEPGEDGDWVVMWFEGNATKRWPVRFVEAAKARMPREFTLAERERFGLDDA